MAYSRWQLVQLLIGAQQLGYSDDVAHWTAELAKHDQNNQGATQ